MICYLLSSQSRYPKVIHCEKLFKPSLETYPYSNELSFIGEVHRLQRLLRSYSWPQQKCLHRLISLCAGDKWTRESEFFAQTADYIIHIYVHCLVISEVCFINLISRQSW